MKQAIFSGAFIGGLALFLLGFLTDDALGGIAAVLSLGVAGAAVASLVAPKAMTPPHAEKEIPKGKLFAAYAGVAAALAYVAVMT